jgi:hypothetical protein
MEPHFVRPTRSFGSFVCVQNLACLRREDIAEVDVVTSSSVSEGQTAGTSEPHVVKPANRFCNFTRRFWQRMTGRAATH